MSVSIYASNATDFAALGLGMLAPLECTLEEVANGKCELTLVHPIDETRRFALLQNGRILKASAPVRESPLLEGGDSASGSSSGASSGSNSGRGRIWVVSGTSHGLYLRSGAGMKYPRIGKRYNGDKIIELEDAPDPWKKVCVAVSGAVGYMSTKYLTPTAEFAPVGSSSSSPSSSSSSSSSSSDPAALIRPPQSREQLFRIYSVEQDSAAQTITARARHIFYDSAAALIDASCVFDDTNAPEAVRRIASFLPEESFLELRGVNLSGKITGDFTWKSPAEALLNPDSGILHQTGALLMRDNFSACVVPDRVRDRGVVIHRGKNLAGVTVACDLSQLVTRVYPVGRKRNGDPLYLSDTPAQAYVDSPLANSYPQIYARRIEYEVEIVSSGADGRRRFSTVQAARERLRALAEAEFAEKGADLPVYSMDVDFLPLENTLEYADYAPLQAVHLFDTVTVIDETLALRARLRVSGCRWDCLSRRYESVSLGAIEEISPSISGCELIDGSVSGTKLTPGSASGSVLRDLSVQYAKISHAAVDQLCADSLTALTARIGEITAEKLTTDELYAQLAEIIALKVNTLAAEDISTDSLAAALANFILLTAKTADFDQATVEHLISSAMNLEFGEAGTVYINNLAVRYAQLMHATIADLCIKANDGNYYTLDVNQSGHVTAVKSTITDGEISMGETFGGKIILETNMTVENLNTSNLLGTYALINKIDAAKIDVGELFAREAFIALLRTTRIIGEKSLSLIAEQSQQASRCFRDSAEPTGTNGAKAGDIWIQPDSGSTYQAESAEDAKLKFAIDREGNLYFSAEDEDVEFETDDFDLFVSGLRISENPDGTLTVPFRWVLVQDESMLASIQHNKDSLDRVIRIDTNGLHVGDSESDNEVLVDSDSVNVVIGGQKYSKFAGRYVQFGNYKIGLADDNGLMFKPL